MKPMETAIDMMKFIQESKTAFHGADQMVQRLKSAGFQQLTRNGKWSLRAGEQYYLKDQSALLAIRIDTPLDGYRIIGSHLDSPCMKIKPRPILEENGYVKLNVEPYGGMILHTWLDRPLSIAGQVMLRGEKILKPQSCLVDFLEPVAVIPSLAIHQNRDVNKGMEFKPQKHMLPLLTLGQKELRPDYLLTKMAENLQVPVEQILDYDLYLYDPQPPCFVGFDQEWISSPRLDNLVMAYTSMKALIESPRSAGIQILAAFDNEEVGSQSAQGAASSLLETTLERIALGLGRSREDHLCNLAISFLLSADMAHGVHPNNPEKSDPTNQVKLGGGPVIKTSAAKKYASDAFSASVFRQICAKSEIPCQTFANHSDERGGSTIGPALASRLGIPAADVGGAMLAMHSVRELMSSQDPEYLYQAFRSFYSLKE